MTFLEKLFERTPDDPWARRWPELEFDPWDHGASQLPVGEEDLRKAALTAVGAELRRILRCGNEQVLLAALENPAVTGEDALLLSTSPRATANVLAAIARKKEWSSSPELARALCHHPKTPYFASRQLLVHLSTTDLRIIASSTVLPPALAKDALISIDKKRTRRHGRG